MKANLSFVEPYRIRLYGSAEPDTVLKVLSAPEGSRQLTEIGQIETEADGSFESEVEFTNRNNPIKLLALENKDTLLSAVINIKGV